MVDSTLNSFVFEITGAPEKIDAFARLGAHGGGRKHERIAHARDAAASALETAVSASFHPDGRIDTGRARELYASSLDLPHGQSSTMPVFSRSADGALKAVVTTATRLTLGGIILPKTFYSAVTYTVGKANPS